MKNVKSWFMRLSDAGKASVIAAIVSGSIITVGAIAVPTTPSNPTSSSENTKSVITNKKEDKTSPIPYGKETIEDSALAKGITRLQRVGTNGVKTTTYNLTLKENVEIGRIAVSEVITKAPISEVTVIGTYVAPPAPKCDSNYSGCVPIVSYDLDCSDIGHSVIVYGSDPHGLDGNNDGEGCESY